MEDAIKKEKTAAEVAEQKKLAEELPKKQAEAKIKEEEAKALKVKKLADEAAKKEAESKK